MKGNEAMSLILACSLAVNLLGLAALAYKYLRPEPVKDWKDYTLKRTYWQDSVGYFALLNKVNPKDVLLVGDSMFDRLPPERIWKDCSVGNRSIGYDNTRALLHRLEQSVFAGNPRKVFLYIGGNDISKRSDLRQIVGEIEQIFDLLVEKGITTYFVSLLPRGKKYDPSQRTLSEINQDLVLFNQMMESKCPNHQVQYINVARLFTDKEGFLNPSLTSDSIHLNAKGIELLTGVLWPYVAEKNRGTGV